MSLLDLERSSVLQSIQIAAAPAAGAEWTFTVPAGLTYKLETIFCTFTTSATVANRSPRVSLSDGTNTFWESSAVGNLVAGNTYRLSWGRLVPPVLTGGGNTTSQFTLPEIWLPAGYIVSSSTNGKDVADQYSAVRALVRVSTADAV